MKAHLFPLMNRGMARDNSISKTEEGLVFENRNIRITANEHDTLMSVTNERGNRKVENIEFKGTLIGWNVLDRYIILFTTERVYGNASVSRRDHIYRVECSPIDGNGFNSLEIFSGNLNFSDKHPIESVVDHETDDILKIYWVDGVNALRYMNFSDKYLSSHLEKGSTFADPKFDFAGNSKWFDTNRQSTTRDFSVSISKDNGGNSRANGTIQYFMTMYMKNGSETSFVYVSPIIYLAPEDRGGKADGFNSNKVVLKIDGSYIDRTFDYVRTYAIVRTSENGQPSGYIISENKITKPTDGGSVEDMIVVDSGNYLSICDPSMLLFMGSRSVVASTLTHKDNTLFLGDLESIGNAGFDEISNKIKSTCFKNKWESSVVGFELSNDLDYNEDTGFYSYDCQLKYPADKITGFKGGEKYRFAFQFRKQDGTLSKAFWIGDKVNPLYPKIAKGKIGRPIVKCTVPQFVREVAEKVGYTSVRLMMASASYSDRSVIAQGILNPTMFNMLDRSNNAPYSIPSWITRPKGGRVPYCHLDGLERSDSPYGEIQCNYWEDGERPSPFKTIAELDGYVPSSSSSSSSSGSSTGTKTAIEDIIDPYGRFKFDLTFTCKRVDVADYNNTPGVYAELYLVFKHMTTGSPMYSRRGTIPIVVTGGCNGVISPELFMVDLIKLWNEQWGIRMDAPSFEFIKTVFDSTIEGGKYDGNYIGECSVYDSGYYPDSYYTETGEPSDSAGSGSSSGSSGSSGSGSSSGSSSSSSDDEETYEKSQRDCFYIDESIVTLNSPEIEYENVNVDRNSGLKLRIVGVADVGSVISDYEMEVSDSRMAGDNVVKENFSAINDYNRISGIMSSNIYVDYGLKVSDKTSAQINPYLQSQLSQMGITIATYSDSQIEFSNEVKYYFINMWNKGGSLIGYKSDADSKYGVNLWAKLDKKVFANLHFCKKTVFNNYKTNVWSVKPDDIRNVSGVNPQMYELKHDDEKCMYVANIDRVIASKKFYPIFSSSNPPVPGVKPSLEKLRYSKDPISMKYRSSSHALISLPKNGASMTILPFIDYDSAYDTVNTFDKGGMLFGWKKDNPTYVDPHQDKFILSNSPFDSETNYLFIGELYFDYDSNPSTDTRYGGCTESAVESNVFVPCSEFDFLVNANKFGLRGTRGDTYFQRWDCIKTLPMGNKDTNSVIDIVSAMLETHINIDGRTDIDRGVTKLALIDTANFGKINRAYSQKDNFSTAVVLDDAYNLDTYSSSLTWTLEKHPSAETDEWTHITLASSLKLDGDKGKLRALRRFQNTIIAFQDRGISEIMFNSRVQLNTADGTPVELANSGKVDGKRYITEKHGCVNKWSIAEGKLGIYFVDDINRSISIFDGQGVQNLSRGGRFEAWMNERLGDSYSDKSWTPTDSGRQFVTYYDKINSEVYFMKWNDDKYPCLVYSEPLAAFTSFYDYKNVPMMTNIERNFISFRDGFLWHQNKGFYNNFFGDDYPFSVTYRVVPDPYTDKIWTNLEYRADFFEVLDDNGDSLCGEKLVDEMNIDESKYNKDMTFDCINVWNEYQKTGDFPMDSVNGKRDIYPDVRSKFRTWRMDIPRDQSSASNPFLMNRIRNPWIYLKLQKNSDGIRKMVVHMHDVIVKYFTDGQ